MKLPLATVSKAKECTKGPSVVLGSDESIKSKARESNLAKTVLGRLDRAIDSRWDGIVII